MISIVSVTPNIFADHPEVTIETALGSGVQGCENTDESCYIPSIVVVDVGGDVIMSNTDNSAIHTFTAGTVEGTLGISSGIFDSGFLAPGESFKYSPDVAGEIPYYCMLHSWMVGVIIVQGKEKIEEEMHVESTEEEMHVESTEEEMHVESTEEETIETQTMDENEGGGCLIATAAYGTELAPQVQFLREIRDNTVMSTASGAAFMTGFNQFYYSFSPTIADMERENPMFQEVVRAFITPMVSTLSIMTLAEDGNESQVLGLGISVIVLNLGMYIATPALIFFVVSKRLKSRN